MADCGGDRKSRGRTGWIGRAQGRGLRCASLLSLLVCVPGCAGSRHQVANGLPSEHAVRSHQVLLLSDEPLPDEDEILRELAQIRMRLTHELKVPSGERDVVVYLFADRERYAAYMREHHPELPARRAFFIGTPKELAVYAHWGDQVLVDLRHEYTHGLLHAAVGHVPLWIDEGIAEYFEVGEETPASVNPEHLGRLVQATSQGWQPNLQRLERLEEVHDMSREDYQEAWAWVHYLLYQAPEGRELISQYLNELRRGQTPVPLSERLGPRLAESETELAAYVARLGSGVQPAAFNRASSR
jgi:hypothetical protein